MYLSSPGKKKKKKKDNWDDDQKYVWELNQISSDYCIATQLFYSGLLENKI